MVRGAGGDGSGKTNTGSFVKFTEFVRPSESDRWDNRAENRIVYINKNAITYVDKQIVGCYDERGRPIHPVVMRINFSDSEDYVLVEGSEDEVMRKLSE